MCMHEEQVCEACLCASCTCEEEQVCMLHMCGMQGAGVCMCSVFVAEEVHGGACMCVCVCERERVSWIAGVCVRTCMYVYVRVYVCFGCVLKCVREGGTPPLLQCAVCSGPPPLLQCAVCSVPS